MEVEKSPLEKGELHQQGQAWPKLNICFNEGGAIPLSSEAPCKDEDCAKLITFKRTVDLSTC
jgi:hypothetical protein